MRTVPTLLTFVISAFALVVLVYFGLLAVLAARDEIQNISSLGSVYATCAAAGGYIVFAPAAMILTYLGATTIWGWESWQAVLLTLPGLLLYLVIVAGDYPEIIRAWYRRDSLH
ncbi:MAG: hypothetical protein AAGH49_09355 [Pseudomonadota bacterium]